MTQTRTCISLADVNDVDQQSTKYVFGYVGGALDHDPFVSCDQALPRRRTSDTGPLRSVVGRFHALTVPVAIVASVFAPAEPRAVSRTRGSAVTGIVRQQFAWQHDEWRYMPEFISEQQVEELRELLSLPRAPGFDFDYLD